MTITINAKPNGTQGAFLINGSESFSFDNSGVDSPVSLSAAINSNAITVTMTKCGLRFRNPTLTNGSRSYVKTDVDVSLVIASTDSFGLGTASGNQRIVILAINNAGTIELAAASLSGGVSLDETGVITTAASSSTSTAVKGLGIRSGVSYRVVGFIDATFTTAVGWGSLTTTQSIGGQALNSINSVGYGQTWYNLTGSRISSTIYYNLTSRPIAVSGRTAAQTDGVVYVDLVINGVTVAGGGYGRSGAGDNGLDSVFGIVPIGSSYTMIGNIGIWAELR